MLILLLFTMILACICLRLLIYFFKSGTTVLQLISIVLLLALTLGLLGYITGYFNIPFLDTLIIK